MEIVSLKLRNFKGIRDLEINFGCENTVIRGDNATGKTTIADAVSWLLFGKDSSGQADFEIKTLVDGDPLHNLDHEVDALFEIGGGATVNLRKVYREKYTRRMGGTERQITGHTTECFIDGRSVKNSEYQDRIDMITGNKVIFRLLTDPLAFPGLHWTKQREILLDICGDISDEDVIASDPSLSDVSDALDGRPVDDARQVLAAQRKKLNKQLNELPARIDEAQRTVPDAMRDPLPVIERLKKLRADREKIAAEIAEINAGGGVAKLRNELSSLQSEMEKIGRAHQNSIDQLIRVARDEHATLARDSYHAIVANKSVETTVTSIRQDIMDLVAKNSQLRDEWKSIKAAPTDVSATCPTCLQALPDDQIDATRANLMENRAKLLAEINEQGKRNSAKINDLEEKIRAQVVKTVPEVFDLEKRIQEIHDNSPNHEELPEYADLAKRAEVIERKIAEIQHGKQRTTDSLHEDAAKLDEKIIENDKIIAEIEAGQRARDRVTELQAEQKTAGAEFARVEGNISLIEKFIRAKVALLDDRINKRFKLVKFRMFDEQINGGISDTCVMTVDGVPFGSLNSAGRIQGGLDIIRTLSGHYGMSPFIMIDGAESITQIPEMDTQVIQLVVSAEHQKLAVNVEGE